LTEGLVRCTRVLAARRPPRLCDAPEGR